MSTSGPNDVFAFSRKHEGEVTDVRAPRVCQFACHHLRSLSNKTHGEPATGVLRLLWSHGVRVGMGFGAHIIFVCVSRARFKEIEYVVASDCRESLSIREPWLAGTNAYIFNMSVFHSMNLGIL